MAKLQFTGVTFGGPRTTNYVAVDLTPGDYFLVCFIHQGGGEDGPPQLPGRHAAHDHRRVIPAPCSRPVVSGILWSPCPTPETARP